MHPARLQGARGPVHAVLCEHWAVYHYWNAAQHRWQVGRPAAALLPKRFPSAPSLSSTLTCVRHIT